MADPIQNLRSLADLRRGYSVFETDQVLTCDQLNSVTEYLGEQQRLTRVQLLGVGIVSGLEVAQSNGKVTVGRGLGITTDGDLLCLPGDAVYGQFKIYDQTAPRYAPFYEGDVMRTVYELVPEGAADSAAQPLTALPGNLAEMVVVMLMESSLVDPDLCSGTECDNLGMTAVERVRMLVVGRDAAAALVPQLRTASDAARGLPELFSTRPSINSTLSTTGGLASAFRNECVKTHNALLGQLGTLHAQIPSLTRELFGTDPSPAWIATLQRHQATASGDLGIQYYYDFLNDVVDTWNDLRDALLADDSLLSPDFGAFPKHLLLGDLTAPARFRTGLFPSPLVQGSRTERDHAKFLALKLDALLRHFSPPAPAAQPAPGAALIRITPSRGESASLEERAIPYYYAAAIEPSWNWRLSRRGVPAANFGYHVNPAGVLNRQLARYDFFRIEGHLGLDVTQVKRELENLIAENNLPITLRAVLLHNDRRRLVIRPPIRYGDLHRFHYLLRKELSVQLTEAQHFNDSFKDEIERQVGRENFPDRNFLVTARGRHQEITSATGDATPALNTTTFTAYQQARQTKDWRGPYKNVVVSAGSYKVAMGEIVRTDFTTPFDSLFSNNHSAWLDWLDTLIQSKDNHEDDKLLFPRFWERHPGFEHRGGVTPGGTFVLLYDDQARVVADGMLPYYWPETAEAEPDEPEQLSTPDFRPLPLIDQAVKLSPPLDFQFNFKLGEFETRLKPQIVEQVNIQRDYMKFFKESVDTLGPLLADRKVGGAVGGPLGGRFSDAVLDTLMQDIDNKKRQLDSFQNLIIDPATSDTTRAKAAEQAQLTERELAASISRGTTYIVQQKVDMTAGSDGSKALAVLSDSIDKVASTTARTEVRTSLVNMQNTGNRPQLDAIGQVFKLKGL